VLRAVDVKFDVARPGAADWRAQGEAVRRSACGIKTVLIPEQNAKDLVEINDSIKSGFDIIPVSRMGEVLTRALTHMPEPIVWDEATAKPVDVPDRGRGGILRPHRAMPAAHCNAQAAHYSGAAFFMAAGAKLPQWPAIGWSACAR
jgi:hypothetical protein